MSIPQICSSSSEPSSHCTPDLQSQLFSPDCPFLQRKHFGPKVPKFGSEWRCSCVLSIALCKVNHSMLSQNLIKSQSQWMRPLQSEKVLIGSPVFWPFMK